MCGITFIKGGEDVSQENVKKYFAKIKYRGPDNTTIMNFMNNNGIPMYFCHHRLSIINVDDESGNQPFVKDNMILICNGEIYNYLALGAKYFPGKEFKNDCEIIIDLYRLLGGIEKTLEVLDGDFAFILYDQDTGDLITGRDPVGLKPLFLGYKNGELVGIASEIKVLTEFVEHIEVHPIGSYSVGGRTMKEYFVYYDELESALLDESNACSTINQLLTKSIEKRITHTEREYAFLCSGGIDSSLILAISLELLHKDNIHVFSIEYDDGKGSISYDSFYATMLTKAYQVKHNIVKFTKGQALDKLEEVINRLETYDINTIRASIPMYLLAEWIAQNTDYKVILSGEGADEAFMGYNYFNFCPSGEEAIEESLRLTKNLYSFDVLRAERCFSSHGLELRVPFLDKDLLKYVLNLDGNLRKPYQGLEKYLLRESFNGLKTMPKQILERQKERFSDGIGFTWVPTLINHAKNTVDDEYDVEEMCYYNAPKNKEGYLYRSIFEKHYPGYAEIIKLRAMPSWAEKISQKAKSTQMLAS